MLIPQELQLSPKRARFENLGSLIILGDLKAQFENLGELVKNTIFVA